MLGCSAAQAVGSRPRRGRATGPARLAGRPRRAARAAGASYRLPIAGHPGAGTHRHHERDQRERPRRRRAAKYQPVSDARSASRRRPLGRARRAAASAWARPSDATRGDERAGGGERADDRDDAPGPAAQHQHDAPGGQGDQGRGRRPAAPTSSPSRRRRRAPPAEPPRRRPSPGRRRPRPAPRAAEPDQDGRAEGTGCAARSAIGAAAARSASKQVRSPVWQAGPSWSTLTSRVSPSQSSRTSLDPLPVAGGLALDPVLLARAAPERRPPGGQRAVQRLVVHPAEHQHLAGVVLLHDRGRRVRRRRA